MAGNESMFQQLTDALEYSTNAPLYPYNPTTVMHYVMMLLLGIFTYRKDIVDISQRITDGSIRSNINDSYDFIIIGGGSAGCVIANRLSENPNWQVFLLEAGGGESVESEVPALVLTLQQNKSVNWDFPTQPSNKFGLMDNGEVRWPRGKIIGGSSVLNYMLYVRGNAKDYDRWRDLGNKGWGYEDVLPYFKKSENIRIPSLQDSPYHGRGGYLSVEQLRYQFEILDVLQNASQEMGYGVTDVNGARQAGFTRIPCTIKDGLRDSTAKAFLRPVKNRPNLHIGLNSFVTKILINKNTKAVEGVKFTKNVSGQSVEKTVYARKEVIISAGSVQSPQLLMLSGVGPESHLKDVDVDVILDAPGVGQNLQDHVGSTVSYFINNAPDAKPYGFGFRMPNVMTDLVLSSFLKNQTGPLYAQPLTSGLIFTNTRYNNDTEWPDVQLFLSPQAYMADGESNFTLSIIPVNLRPFSRGWIKLRDNNPKSYPLINANYFDDPRDLKITIDSMKIAQKIFQTKTMKEYNLTWYSYGGCENYTLHSDEFWECQARYVTIPIFHPSGTCKMGPRSDKFAVVDDRLKVHGIKKLRVADASIMPYVVSGNTNAAVIMIGEKISDFIKEDWSKEDKRN